ncbi:hypothetical protein LCGC14_0549590 [marine sediment metagenome]|uniref:Uncharacterized protein n=1 Tax=marine sediment metagenome TaxID=412755 RepID=A0A0F9S8Q6_9ZZZZ
MLGTILELIPFVGPVISVIGLVSDAVAEPSSGGAMVGLVTTVLTAHFISPYAEKFVEWTETPFDNKAWNVFTTVLGWVTEVLVKLGKIDAKEIKRAVIKEV